MEKKNLLAYTDFSLLKVSEIQELLKTAEFSADLIPMLKSDSRQGVQKLALQLQRQLEEKLHLEEQFTEMLTYESNLWGQGIKWIAGVDEAGRGPLAGPVVAAAVIINPDFRLLGINDSKQLTEEKREEYYQLIIEKATAVGVGIVDHAEIDQINILQASFKAMTLAVKDLEKKGFKAEVILVDGNLKIPELQQVQYPIVDGDAKSISIAASSVIAKVTRDRIMVEISKKYPGYGFERNKGYGAQEHLEGLRKFGPTPIHRMTFSTVRHALYSEIFHQYEKQIKEVTNLGDLKEVGIMIGRNKGKLSFTELEELRQLYVKLERKLKSLKKMKEDL